MASRTVSQVLSSEAAGSVQDPQQFGDPLVDVPLAALHQSVGVEGEQAALGQLDLGGLEGQPADAERRSRLCGHGSRWCRPGR